MGQLKRLGAITGAPSGPQSKGRALFAGLVALAKHTTTPAKVIVQLSTVWEAWHKPHTNTRTLTYSLRSQTKIANASQSSMSAATQGPQMHPAMNHNSDGDKEMPL